MLGLPAAQMRCVYLDPPVGGSATEFAGAAFEPLEGMTASVSLTVSVWWRMDARTAGAFVAMYEAYPGARHAPVAGHDAVVFSGGQTKYGGGSAGVGIVVDRPLMSGRHLQIRIEANGRTLPNAAATEAATLALAQKAAPVVFRAAGL